MGQLFNSRPLITFDNGIKQRFETNYGELNDVVEKLPLRRLCEI